MKKKIFSAPRNRKTRLSRLCASLALCLSFSLQGIPLPAYAAPCESAAIQTLNSESEVDAVTGSVAENCEASCKDSDSVSFTDESFVSLSEAAELCRQNMKERNESFTIRYHYTESVISSEIIAEEANKILNEAFDYTGDGAEGDALLYQTNSWSCTSRYSGISGDYNITFTFTMDYETTASQEEQVSSSVSSILSSLEFQCESDYEKVLAIYDAVCSSIEPDENGSRSVYGTLASGKANSEGYSLLLYRLLLDSGIDCRVVCGEKNGSSRFWNIICLGDLWYNADAYSDAQTSGHACFLKSDASFSGYDRGTSCEERIKDISCAISASDYDPKTSGGNESKHVAVKDPAVEASCEENGLTEGSHCSVCGKVLEKQETIQATGHTPVKTEGKEADCVHEGLTSGSVCSTCGKVLEKQETIPAKGHTAVSDPAVEASCTEDGLTEGSYCSVCGKILKKQKTVPATGHTIVKDQAVEPSCTKSGFTEGKHCSVCGKVLVKQKTVSPTGHSWNSGTVTKKATCVDNGVKTYTCASCGATKQEIIPANGHTPVKDSAVAATCSDGGKTEGVHCSVCGKVLSSQKSVSAEGHSWKQTSMTTGTCLSEGKAEYTCAKCGAVKTETLTSRGGHTVVPDAAVSATCAKDGLTEGSHCSVCGEIIKAQQAVPATGHAWEKSSETKASCEEDGNVVYTCSRCGNTKSEFIPASGHTIVSEEAVPASCAVTGLTEGSYCSVCGKVFSKQETVQTLPHAWELLRVSKEATCTEDGRSISICSACGQIRTDIIQASGHEMAVDRAVQATKATTGLTEGLHCAVCGKVFVTQEIIPMLNSEEETDDSPSEETELSTLRAGSSASEEDAESAELEEEDKEETELSSVQDEDSDEGEGTIRKTSSLTIGNKSDSSQDDSLRDAERSQSESEFSEGDEEAESPSSGLSARNIAVGAAGIAAVAAVLFILIKFIL